VACKLQIVNTGKIKLNRDIRTITKTNAKIIS
jgi:hypothetical protein